MLNDDLPMKIGRGRDRCINYDLSVINDSQGDHCFNDDLSMVVDRDKVRCINYDLSVINDSQ